MLKHTVLRRGLCIVMLCLLPLCGCKAANGGFVGEKEAVAAARALLERAYGALPEGEEVFLRDKAVEPLYEIYLPQREGNGFFARVDALTGLAYQAARPRESLPMSGEQRAKVAALGDMDAFLAGDWERLTDEDEAACEAAAIAFAEERFADGRGIVEIECTGSMTDNIQFPLIDMYYDVHFDDGACLNVSVVWPQVAVYECGY